MTDSQIVTSLERHAASDPVLSDERGRQTVGDLLTTIDQVGALLESLALERTARVCVVMSSDRHMASVLLSLMCRVTCTPLDPRLTDDEFLEIFDDVDADLLVGAVGVAPAAWRAARQHDMTILGMTDDGQLAVVQRGAKGYRTHPSSYALLLRTSGTTAKAKLVGLTEANLLHSAAAVAETLRLGPTDICLGVMPLFHIHGIVGVLLASVLGGSAVHLLPRFDPFAFNRQLADPAVTWTSAVPSVYRAVLSRSRHERALPLRLLRSGSAPLSADQQRQLEARFECPVINSYGMTEASHQMTSTSLGDPAGLTGTVGPPAGADVAVLVDCGLSRVPGDFGEVVVRGPGVIDRYLSPPEANHESHHDGWLRTGDLGSLGVDGRLTLHGRIKEMINVSGEKVSPFEVEEVVARHPALMDVVAFAAPDQRRGEQVTVAVVVRQGSTAPTTGELRSFASESLAAFKVPRRIIVVDSIPLGPTGKVQRSRLASMFGLEQAD